MLTRRAQILKGWQHIVLSDTTLRQYVHPPEELFRLGQTHKSDWLRLALLNTYGGCWMDASILVNDESAWEAIYDESVRRGSEMTAFYTPLGIIHNDPSTYVESWCVLAPTHSPVIQAWLEEYTSAMRQGFLEYRRASSRVHTFSPHMYNPEKPDEVYLTVYAACQMAIQRRISPQTKQKIMLLNSYESMYKLHAMCWDVEGSDYNHECIVQRLLYDPHVDRIPFLKFTAHTRKVLEETKHKDKDKDKDKEKNKPFM